jgi:uncharacterized delta-60 repeat protein
LTRKAIIKPGPKFAPAVHDAKLIKENTVFQSTFRPRRALLLLALGLTVCAQAGASSGELDPAFGDSGWFTLPASTFPSADFVQVQVDLDGSIVLLGRELDIGLGTLNGCFVARLLPEGSLDPAFGSNGIAQITKPGGTPFRCEDSLLMPDGSLLISGFLEVMRMNADGTIDSDFGIDGLLSFSEDLFPETGNGPREYDLTMLASGEVLYSAYNPFDPSDAVWALNPENTSASTRFDYRVVSSEIFLERPGGGVDGLSTIGGLYFSDNLLNNELFRSELDPAGTGGRQDFLASELLRQPDGKLVAAMQSWGSAIGSPRPELAVGRWDTGGNPDAGFTSGPNAPTGLSLVSPASLGFVAESLANDSSLGLHPDGYLIQTTNLLPDDDSFPSPRRGSVVLLQEGGSPETTWGNGGISILHYPGSLRTRLFALALDAFNGVLVAGYGQQSDGTTQPVVARLQPLISPVSSWDTLPDAVSLPPLIDAPRNALVESATLTISGLDADSHVPAMVENGEYRVNSGPWVAAPSWVGNGDTIRIRHRTPGDGNASTLTTLRVGGVLDPQNARRSTGQVQFFSFQSVTIDPLPGGKCSQASLCDDGQAIPDNSPSTPAVAFLNQIGACPFIRSIRVGLNISHTYVGDLQVILDPPNTAPFSLINRPNAAAGNCSADDILATFELGDFPQAQTQCGQLGEGLRAIDGTVRPALGFPQVIGSNGQGAWRLSVSDYAGSDVGTLNDWSLELDCANEPLDLADLEVTTTQPANLFAGESRIWTISVTNNGPARANFARFYGEVTRSAVSGLPELNPSSWSCSAPAGSSCLLPPGCTGTFCGGASFSPALDLAPGASATIELLAAPDSLTPLGNEVGFTAVAENALAFGGATDPDPGNNAVTYRRDVLVAQDLGITDARAIIIGNEVEVSFRITNAGPSAERRSARVDVRMPSGYVAATRADCSRGSSLCTGRITAPATASPSWVYEDFILVPGSTPERLSFRAAFSGSVAPGGPIEVEISGAKNEQDSSDNAVSLTPQLITDSIFSDRFQ